MGTGKTSLGKILSAKLGYPFVDLDQKIELDHQMKIPEIFEKYGEEYFRTLEKKAVEEVSQKRGIIIATGGGTVKDSDNVRLLKSSGVMICLTCEPEEILNRTIQKGDRPVLDSNDKGDRLSAIKKLLDERKHFYNQADFKVDTTEWSPLKIMEEIKLKIKDI